MLMTIFIVLLALWLLGVVSGNTLEGFVHLLLLFAVVALLINLIRGASTAV